jgi:RHS repeat-associated protein
VCASGAKCASRKKSLRIGRRVFVLRSQPLIAPREIALGYDKRASGECHDAETGLFYNMARDYDPGTGRYIQAEPLGIAADINLYRYARTNPLKYIDPDGNQAIPMPTPTPAPGVPSPWNPKPRSADNPLDQPAKPGWRWPSLPDWFSRPLMSESTEQARARCEAQCDKDYDFDQKQCEAWWKTTGRNPSAYRGCMDRARANYIKCYQDCANECK